VFFLFLGAILIFGWGRVEVRKKNVLDTEKAAALFIIAHYCANTPPPDPLYCLQYCTIYFPHDPFIHCHCNKQ